MAGKPNLRSPIRVGEAVALIGVIIAGLGLYVSYNDRQRDKQDAVAQAQQQARAKSVLVLRGDGGGSHIRLEPANPSQVVQSQVFYFPAAIRADPVHVTGGGRMDADWFAAGLKKVLKGSADGRGQRDMPIGVATSFVEDGETRTDNAIYQLGFAIHPRLLQPAIVEIQGVALSRRGLGNDLQSAVNNAWARQARAGKS